MNLSDNGNKPIVRILSDVQKTYVMAHHSSGGLFGRRRKSTAADQPVIVHALRGVSVDFYPGEYVAIMGASGSR